MEALIIVGIVTLVLLFGVCVYALIDFFNQINNIK
jgi:hypothetical protein